MAHVIDGSIGANLAATTAGTTTDAENALFKLGSHVEATDNQVYCYVQASAAIVQYDAVGIDENFQAAPLTDAMAADGWQIGFAQIAFSDNDLGWVALRGTNISCNLLGDTAVDADLFTTGTAGKLDDSSGTGTKIDGVVNVAATSTATAAVEIIATYPRSSTF